jgi:hypothetical protein
MTYADEAGSPPSTGDGDGQGDLHKGNGGTADAEMVDADVAAARVSGADVAAARVSGADVAGAAVDVLTAPDGAGSRDLEGDRDQQGDVVASDDPEPSKVSAWAQRKVRLLGQPEPLVTLAVVVVCVGFVFWQFEPSKLFLNTTISGGDTGAHVLLPSVAEHQCLTHFRLTCWTSSNWDGFPAVTFYFPLPIYSVVALAQIMGYNVAFKLCTAAPMILMPVAAWLMGRIARAPFPIPAVLAIATVPYIFQTDFSIYGGNIASTLAGEFAFAWSLWFALVFFGFVMRGLQTGRYRAWAAVMLACCFMSHIDPAMFAGGGALALILMYAVRNRDWAGAFWWAAPSLVVGGLLAAWWALPFGVRQIQDGLVTDMGYTRNTAFLSTLFPTGYTWLFVLGGMGAVLSIARRRRMGEFLTIMALLSVFAFRYMPQSILWNNRVLPFWFLCLYLLSGLALAELYAIMVERTTNFMVTLRAALLPAPLLVLVVALVWVGFPLQILPGQDNTSNANHEFLGVPSTAISYVPGWIGWNYSGYQYECPPSPGKCDPDDIKSRWPEYTQILKHLGAVSKTYGCGELMWEYQSQMNDYGTPDALTILPYWTNGCIDSMEGLYYEASATTPFHFLDQNELSLQPSNPMVGLPYGSAPNVTLGVEHLQMLGVKYYMALNTAIQKQADADPSLKLISTFGPFAINYTGNTAPDPTGTVEQYWKLYLVLNSPRVHPLADQPVVMEGLNNSAQPKYLKVMDTWYLNPSAWNVYLAAAGPSNWARVPYDDTNVPVKPEPKTTVSDIVEHNSSISFNVSRVGAPVVVTISYFPNWHVSGAEGVYRVSPNLMVVVPTSHHVSLSYGYTPVDFEGYALTLLALVGLLFLVRRPLAPVAAVRRPGLGQRLEVLGAIGGTPARPQGPWQPTGGPGTTPYWPAHSSSAPWPGSPEEVPVRNGDGATHPNGATTPGTAPTNGDGATPTPHWVAGPAEAQWEPPPSPTAPAAVPTGHTAPAAEPSPED